MSGIMMMVLGGVGGPPPPPPGPAIGSAYGGGFYAGQISTAANGVATHNLVVGPRSTAQSPSNIEWSTTFSSTPGTTSVIDGPGNTAAMIAAGAANHPAGQFCDNLTVGGFSDWYMPAVNELEVCYYNLKHSTADNMAGSGINPNAVPPRSTNYTATVPAQTSATQFQSGGSESFESATTLYWSSTEQSAMAAVAINMNAGNKFPVYKSFLYYAPVRAIRRVAV